MAVSLVHIPRLESRGGSPLVAAIRSAALAPGVTAVDATIPIGRGQRELIIGDRKTVAVDAKTDVVCVYVAIGQKISTVVEVVSSVASLVVIPDSGVRGCRDGRFTVVREASPLQFLAPYNGAAIAEWFMYNGGATCTVYDDLTKNAVGYREMYLLLGYRQLVKCIWVLYSQAMPDIRTWCQTCRRPWRRFNDGVTHCRDTRR